MDIFTEEQLVDALDNDLAWRKKELTYIYSNISTSNENNMDTNLRIGIAMLYAHWEGYIKNSSQYYLNYLTHQDLQYSNLNENFIALCLRGQFNNCGKKTSLHTEIVKILLNDLSRKISINYGDAIKTNSNLRWEVFNEILLTLNLSSQNYATKEHMIDEILVDTRNAVAHGQHMPIKLSDYIVLYTDILNIIESYKNQIIDNVLNKYYLNNRQ